MKHLTHEKAEQKASAPIILGCAVLLLAVAAYFTYVFHNDINTNASSQAVHQAGDVK